MLPATRDPLNLLQLLKQKRRIALLNALAGRDAQLASRIVPETKHLALVGHEKRVTHSTGDLLDDHVEG